MRRLDMSVRLGRRMFDAMLKELLKVIESTNWDEIPGNQSSSAVRTDKLNFSPGRNSEKAGDFVDLHPLEWRFATAEEAKDGRVKHFSYDKEDEQAAQNELATVPSALIMEGGRNDEEGQKGGASKDTTDPEMEDYVEDDETADQRGTDSNVSSSSGHKSEEETTRALLKDVGWTDEELETLTD